MVRHWSMSVALLIGTACEDRPPEPEPVRGAPSSVAHPPVAAPKAAATKLGIVWTDPGEWKRIPPANPMRKASFVVPKVPGDEEDAEVRVYYFGAERGGTVEQNVSRWLGQFPDAKDDAAKRSKREAHGLTQHLVEVESATYQSGMPTGPKTPKKGFGLIGAIIETPTGNYFFKMTGPSRTVKAARPAFIGLLDTVKAS